ncbi:MAG: SPOR domain-containing protein [Chitinophagaceae bacterium]|nr:SPOR domain-containing protein [Polaromonas sp.]
MLRLFVLLLILANAGYYAYSYGHLAAYGFAPATQTEPQRMTQQIKPETLRILNPQETTQLESGKPLAVQSTANGSTISSPTECLQVGMFNEEQTVVLRERLVSVLPQGSWEIESALVPARWLVYMGKYNSDESVVKKKSELRGLGVSFEALNNAMLEPGLSLGNFKTQPEAQAELERIAKKGVKTAKVIQERAEQRGQRLKLPAVDTALRSRLDAVKPQLAGKALQICS